MCGAIVLLRDVEFSKTVARAIRASAGVTFSIYLLHYPVQMLLSAATQPWGTSSMKTLAIAAISLAVAAALGLVLEPLKTPLSQL